MLAAIKNYDILCYRLRNNLYSQLENPLKKESDQLSKNIAAIMLSGEEIQTQSVLMLPSIFKLRIRALRWLADGHNDYLYAIDEVTPQIEKIKADKKLEVLAENLLFALRCNQRVVESLLHSSESDAPNFSFAIKQLPEITYEQFLASLAFAFPDNEGAQKMIDLINSSLLIEFSMVAADIISNDSHKIPEKNINELAALTAHAAQEYSALATELGILKSHAARPHSDFSFDRSFINEQKYLADSGLEDFDKSFLD